MLGEDGGSRHVERCKEILVGRCGTMVQQIGMRPRPEIKQLLGQKIVLDLVRGPAARRLHETIPQRLGL